MRCSAIKRQSFVTVKDAIGDLPKLNAGEGYSPTAAERKAEHDRWLARRADWHEAFIVEEPRKKNATEPRVLVRRRLVDIAGPNNEEIVLMPGEPVISLFTGGGGFDIGVEDAGFCCVVQHEWEYHACNTLLANRPDFFRHAALIQGDIRQTPTSMILKEAGLRCGEASLVIGGPPCQGFTTANSNRGKFHDQRNDLVFEYLRVIREARPKYFVFENVAGFQTLNDGEYMHEFLRVAYDCYYELIYGLMDAVDYGVPQHRCRFICMGTRRDIAEIENSLAQFPKPTHFSKKSISRIKQFERAPLFHQADLRGIDRVPGIRYFPDRPVLRAPAPNSSRGCLDMDRSNACVAFYEKLRREEPDRIVE